MARAPSSTVVASYPSNSTHAGFPMSERDHHVDGNKRDSLSAPANLRPNIVRRETDQILSYYQSEHAGQSGVPDDEEDASYARSSSRLDAASTRSYTPSNYSSDSHYDNPESPVQVKRQRSRRGGADSLVTERSAHSRRPSGGPSEGNSDRRRLAIVELDSPAPPSLLPRSGLRKDKSLDAGFSLGSGSVQSRRGNHIRELALVAPPDASPTTYTNLTPPPSAPIVPERILEATKATAHSRSASAVAYPAQRHLRHKSSRDIGIVGTTEMHAIPERVKGNSIRRRNHVEEEVEGLRPPIFQTPGKSRSPSPAAQTPDLSDSMTTSFTEPYQTTPLSVPSPRGPLLTPEIGEGKDIKQPVVGPVVVNLGSDHAMRRPIPSPHFSPASPTVIGPRGKPVSPYIFYEPGVHATAGPLPPPPKSIFDADNKPNSPPPRPPRLRTPFGTPAAQSSAIPDIQALKESLQLPKSVSEKLASRSNSQVDLTKPPEGSPRSAGEFDRNSMNQDQELRRVPSFHRREGAFPPSSSTSATDSPIVLTYEPKQVDEMENTVRVVVASVEADTDSESSKPWFNTPLRHQTSWVSIHEGRESSPQGRPDLSRQNTSSDRSFGSSPPPVPSKAKEETRLSVGSNQSFKTAITNLKRFSALPRTPSQMSMTPSFSSHQSRTPSPSLLSLPPPPKREPQPKVIARWPLALQFSDVLSKKSSSERAKGYAEKINELSQFDCGLSDWVTTTRYRGTNTNARSVAQASIHNSPRAPSSFHFTPQPRHTSHGSMASEATFPVRPDAYMATDLATREEDDISSTKSPPPLPYPSLVTSPRISNRASMLTISSQRYELPLAMASSKSSGNGFFASFGRKASMKKERSLTLNPPSPHKVLTKRLPDANRTSPARPPVQLSSPPQIPGGPRTVPTRMQRSQTISVSPTPPSAPAPVAVTSTEISRRNTHMTRRPSLFTRGASVVTGASSSSTSVGDPSFEDQVDKLADLLPHADRRVLAGYLRRSGQDILAIGQYLEDEKNGCLRRD
ncbi:hypothetical protein BXZ70DRAFT_420932 [Cristinia sonorae]|uniref:Uncharacterized protein n=1 Tax=Cristinia sonorae TaxID=1940300 RepID=A0A8K0UXR2_9AGAR|nr:hypothetical protein BXZ70DRAFT_420932 [Cristinia sonorae]